MLFLIFFMFGRQDMLLPKVTAMKAIMFKPRHYIGMFCLVIFLSSIMMLKLSTKEAERVTDELRLQAYNKRTS